MDDILIEIEKKNLEIEKLLNNFDNLFLENISEITKLYSEKKILIEKFIDIRVSDKGKKLVSENKLSWQNKFDYYLSYDKKVVDKLQERVDLMAINLKKNENNKRLLIYSK